MNDLIRLTRRDAANPDRVADHIAARMYADRKPPRFLRIPVMYDRCRAVGRMRQCVNRERSSLGFAYCKDGDHTHCPHVDRGYAPAGHMTYRQPPDSIPRFACDPVTREVRAVWDAIAHDLDGYPAVTVAALNAPDSQWDALDALCAMRWPRQSVTERRLLAQDEVCRVIAAAADALYAERSKK